MLSLCYGGGIKALGPPVHFCSFWCFLLVNNEKKFDCVYEAAKPSESEAQYFMITFKIVKFFKAVRKLFSANISTPLMKFPPTLLCLRRNEFPQPRLVVNPLVFRGNSALIALRPILGEVVMNDGWGAANLLHGAAVMLQWKRLISSVGDEGFVNWCERVWI